MIKLFTLLCSVILLSACSLLPQSLTKKITPTPSPQLLPSVNTLTSGAGQVDSNPIVAISTVNGQIVVRLYANVAPNTVSNFLKKANTGFYNNLTFHRVISGFMAQGGDPTGTGTGGDRQKSELNTIPFKRGSLGLARTADTKEYSNDSQFFICYTTEGCQHLTGEYVNFGEVISGFDVLDKILQNDKIIQVSQSTK